MTGMSTQSSQEYALRLLNSQDEDEAEEVIDEIEYEFDTTWKAHGTEMNYTVVYSNPPNPVACFAELVVNSIDAILRKKYQEKHGTQYDSSTGLITAEDAVEELFPDGEMDEELELIADGGTGDNPNLIVRDTGGGQPPSKFEERFLHLAAGGQFKDDWPFLQGRFKMGGSAALQYSGSKGYKFVLSAGFRHQREWSWSIIRDNPEEGKYEYLTIDGDIPQFTGEVRGQTHGTFAKVYDYKYGSSEGGQVQNILAQSGFRDKLDRVLVDPAIPYRVSEDRDVSSKVTSHMTKGLMGRLEETRIKEVKKLDRMFHHDFGDPFGLREVRVVVFKDDATLKESDHLNKRTKNIFVTGQKHREKAVMYLVNGQTHAHETERFLTGSRGCQYPKTGEDTLVFLDMSDFANKEDHARKDFLQLFSPSRDRMGGNQLADDLQDELVRALKNYDPLDEEEKWRRQRLTQQSRDERTVDVLRSILDDNPDVRKFFESGSLVEFSGTENPGNEEYDAPFFPTTLEIITRTNRDGTKETWDQSKGTFTRNQPVNRNTQMRFKLDAPNDYFNREEHPGSLNVDGAEISSWGLNNGGLTMQLKPEEDADPGETKVVSVEVTRGPKDPLNQEFEICYTKPTEPPAHNGGEEEERDTDDASMPEIIEVWEDPEDDDLTSWDDMGGWEEDDIVEVHTRDDSREFFVNMDAGPIKHFLNRHDFTEAGKETVREVWKVGIVLYSLSQIVVLEEDHDDIEEDPEEIVPVVMKGIAQSMLDQHLPTRRGTRFKSSNKLRSQL